MATLGQRFFPQLATVTVSFWNFVALVFLSVHYNWPSSGLTLGIVLSALVSAIIGYVFYKFFWATIGILGLFSGYFLGSFVYAMFVVLSGWEYDMLMSMVSGSSATIGCYMAYKHGDKLALGLTSVIGPYQIVRGASLLLGGFPCEIDLIRWINGGPGVHLGWPFYVYSTVFVLLAVFSFMFQVRLYG